MLANVTAVYPLVLLGALYVQWLLSWWILGHQPRPSLDDPKDIVGANWLHAFTGLALLGFLPVGCGAVVLNALRAARDRTPGLAFCLRTGGAVALWLGTLALLRFDPGRVVCWWFD